MEATIASQRGPSSHHKNKSRNDSRDDRGRGSRDGREKMEFQQTKRMHTNIDMAKISQVNQVRIAGISVSTFIENTNTFV